MTTTKQARLQYIEGTDSYELSVWDPVEGTWNLTASCQCRHAQEDPNGGADYIHYSILTQVMYLVHQGYTFVYNY